MSTETRKSQPASFGPMGRNQGMMQGGEKPKNFTGTMKQLVRYMRPHWVAIVLVIVFAIASTVFAILSPKILGHMTNVIVDNAIEQMTYDRITESLPVGTQLPAGTTGAQFLTRLPVEVAQAIPEELRVKVAVMDLSVRPVFDYVRLGEFALQLLILYVASAVFNYIQGWLMTRVSQRITYQFRKDLAAKISRLPLKYFDTRTHGEVLSRVTNDVDTVSQTLNQSMSQIITSIVMLVGILIMMLTISWQMTCVALVMIPFSFVLIAVIAKTSQKYFKEQQVTLGKINGHVEEMYSGHNVMRVFNGEKQSIAQFRALNSELYGSGWKSQFLSGLLMPMMSFIGNLNYVGVSVVGGWLALQGKVNIGDIQAFIQYVSQFNQPIVQTANSANVLQSTAAAAERVFEFLAEAEETDERAQAHALSDVRGAVEFDHVSFGYTADKTIIHDFTTQVLPGQRVAIVGPTGAGKTTLVNLLMRFYDVSSGAIRIDGVDVRDMTRAQARTLFGMVLQDTWLFNGTIRDNIAYGKPDATEEEIIAAATAAHAHHFIQALPKGYDMVLDEEVSNISQGEKQLLTIARAMLVKTPMLILDEATSSVDTRTEVLIQKAMDTLMKGKTSFVIAHRLSTIRNADLILVMRDGNIAEQGTHTELLARKGFYASMYNSQFSEVEVG